MDNQPQPSANTQSFDATYLDQISAPQKANNKLFSGKMLILLGGLIVVVIAAVAMMVAAGGSTTPKTSSETLYLRLTNLQATAKKYSKYIKSSSLSAANSAYMVQLTNSVRELGTQMTAQGIKPEKIDKKLKATEKERADAIDKALEDARLNVRLDRNYAKEMVFQIDTAIILMQKIEKKAKGDFKTTLESTEASLKAYSERFAKFVDD